MKQKKKNNWKTSPNSFVEYADRDLEAAKILFPAEGPDLGYMNQAAYLSAQAAEKYLKAFILKYFWEENKLSDNNAAMSYLSSFKHDLKKLLKECLKKDSKLGIGKEIIYVLDKYSGLKYPDIEDSMLFSEKGLVIGSDLATKAESIGNIVKERLGQA